MDYIEPAERREPWVNAEAVAEHLGFKPDHIRKLAAQGKLPGAQMQNGARVYWRFKLSEIDASLASNAIQQITIAMPVLSALAGIEAIA